MSFPCEKCGACCRAVRCKHLIDNQCSIYETRPTICRVDEMAKIRNISLEAAYKNNKQACKELQTWNP